MPNTVTSLLSADGKLCIHVAEASCRRDRRCQRLLRRGQWLRGARSCTLVDTRNAPTVDGQFSNVGIVGPGAFVEVQVAGRGGVPADATGAVLNVTATDGTGTGYVTVWPCSGPPPNSSTVNFVAGAPRANASISMLSSDGTVCLVVQEASAQLIVDVNGHL